MVCAILIIMTEQHDCIIKFHLWIQITLIYDFKLGWDLKSVLFDVRGPFLGLTCITSRWQFGRKTKITQVRSTGKTGNRNRSWFSSNTVTIMTYMKITLSWSSLPYT